MMLLGFETRSRLRSMLGVFGYVRDASGSLQRSGICSSLVGKIGLLVVSSEWENMVAYVHLIQHSPSPC